MPTSQGGSAALTHANIPMIAQQVLASISNPVASSSSSWNCASAACLSSQSQSLNTTNNNDPGITSVGVGDNLTSSSSSVNGEASVAESSSVSILGTYSLATTAATVLLREVGNRSGVDATQPTPTLPCMLII